MIFRRGFKAEAERIANELRSELGLSAVDRLEPCNLAEHLAVPVVPMTSLPTLFERTENGFVGFFREIEPDSFSAVTVFQGSRRIIIHNDSHHLNRQASNLAHELAHCILEHEPAPLTDKSGCRYWRADVESEADWLGAALLIPRDGGLQLARQGLSLEEIAQHFGVSEQLCRWRLHQTGVLRQLERLARMR